MQAANQRHRSGISSAIADLNTAAQKFILKFDPLTLDLDGDGQISSTDAQFASLRVWRDLTQDSISQSGELTTLAAQGIASINAPREAQSTLIGHPQDIGTVTGMVGDDTLKTENDGGGE